MIVSVLHRLVGNGAPLTESDAEAVMTQIMEGGATPAQIASLLTALRMRGETVEVITGFARVMRAHSIRVMTNRTPLVDTCGTGGDTCKTFNISTAAAFVASAAGAVVAKHGNRAVTSKCGSADVLEALGIRLDLSPESVGHCLDEIGIGFLFARSHHPAMKHAAVPRAELGIRTVFNALGPLTNPAGATRQVVGVYDPALCPLLAQVLLNLGAQHVLVVHGMAGLDEIATFGETRVSEGKSGIVRTFTLRPETLGLHDADPHLLAPGENAAESARILQNILDGTDRGPRRDIVLANAGAALVVAGIADDLPAGVTKARTILESGAAWGKVEALRRLTKLMEPAGK